MKKNDSAGYLAQMDGLRCMAVAAVIFSHWFQHFFKGTWFYLIPFGGGVNLFYVISGFLITGILISRNDSIREGRLTLKQTLAAFFARRTLRIFPVYYLAIFFLYAIDFKNIKQLMPWLATYTTNIYISLQDSYIDSFTHLWSLAVEEQFYLIWPFLMLLVPRRHLLKCIIAVIVFSLLFKIYLYAFTDHRIAINMMTPSCFDSLGLGALLAYWNMYDKRKISIAAKSRLLFAFSLALFIIVCVIPAPEGFMWASRIFGNTILSLVFFFIVAKAAISSYKGKTAAFLENGMTVYLGRISYGLYLYHMFVPDLYYWLARQLHLNSGAMFEKYSIIMALTLLLSVLSWHLIEKPLNNLKKHFVY